MTVQSVGQGMEEQLTFPWTIGGWRRPGLITTGYLVLNIVLGVALLLVTNGNVVAVAGVAVVLAVGLISVYRLDWGFYFLVAVVLIADQVAPHGLEEITYQISYFRNLKDIPYLPSFDAGVINPLELHLLSLFTIWIVIAVTSRKLKFVPLKMPGLLVLFFLWFLFSFVWGQSRGGQFLASLWEMRAMCYFGIVYLFVPQVIRTREQVQIVLWICIVSVALKALQGIGWFVSLGFTTGGYDELTNSEDPVFMVDLLFLFLGLWIFKDHSRQRRVLAWLLVILLLGIYVGQRRATYASFMITLIGFFILLPRREARIFRRYLLVGLVIFGVYTAIFWNSPGRLGSVAQQVKSVFVQDPGSLSLRNYLSNLYREYENYNVSKTIQRSPIIGIGFGNMYDLVITFSGSERLGMLSYVPHNSILWLFMKTGAIGFFFFFLFVDAFLCIGGISFMKAQDPYAKALIAVCVLGLINQLVVDFVEMQLTFYRPMIVLGILMGLLPTFQRISVAPVREGAPPSQ